MASEATDSKEPLGLDLPTIRLQRLSGPVSMFYLKPKKEIYDAFHAQGLDLPLFLLFGDVHQSEKGMCEECECSDDCCKLIYDKEFLREFDMIARETPVDFYTESSPVKEGFHKSDNNTNILFKDFIDKTVRDCHQAGLRTSPEYIQKCPTKYIRWHYGDIRFFSSYIEGFMLYPLKMYIGKVKEIPYRKVYDSMFSTVFKSSIHSVNRVLYNKAQSYNISFLSNLRRPLLTGDLTKKDKKILEFISSKKRHLPISIEIIKDYSSVLLRNDFLETVKSIQERYKEYISEKTLPYLPLVVYILNQILEPSYTFRLLYIQLYLMAVGRLIDLLDDYYTFLLPFKEENTSGIYKQLEKQSVPELRDISFWRNLTIENMIRKHSFVEQIIYLDLYQRDHNELFTLLYDKLELCLIDPLNNMSSYSLYKYMSNESMDQHLKNIIDILATIIRSFNSSMLDTYTLTRVFKTPTVIQSNGSIQKETQSTLSLGFFGDSHTNKIVWALLSSPFHYELSYYYTGRGLKDGTRCIQIDDHVPLLQDVTDHHEMRFEGINYEKSNQYYARLRREQRARMKARSSTRKSSTSKRSTRKSSTKRSMTSLKK